jgi:glycerol-3-phosphate dehydrogenase
MSSPDPNRRARIEQASSEIFDLIIVGGGIVGASLARDAVLRGYRTLLLEANDYAHGTSSRSSKMLHGGIRYLEQGDVGLVHEALRERDILLSAAGHLNRVQECLFPAISGRSRPAWQIGLGLKLYDFLAGNSIGGRHSHFGKSAAESPASDAWKTLRSYGLEFDALYRYFDGQMDDRRIVIENILDASALGAVTINHARVRRIRRLRGGNAVPPPRRMDAAPLWLVSWDEEPGGGARESRARFLLNAAGPWVEAVHALASDDASMLPELLYSRGTHVLFDQTLPLPSLTIPTGVPGRYYFVHPYFSPFRRGTLVGPTHGEPRAPQDDPQPGEEEIAELLGFLERDLPRAGLTAKNIYRAFCGLRTLVLTGAKTTRTSISDVSRRDHFAREDGYIAVLGGKYTTARMTAENALDTVDRYFGRAPQFRKPQTPTRRRPLPGGVDWTSEVETRLIARLKDAIMKSPDHWKAEGCEPQPAMTAAVASFVASTAVHRLGARSIELLESSLPGRCCFLSADYCCLEEELLQAGSREQALSADDVLIRRLSADAHPGPLSEWKEAYRAWWADSRRLTDSDAAGNI